MVLLCWTREMERGNSVTNVVSITYVVTPFMGVEDVESGCL